MEANVQSVFDQAQHIVFLTGAGVSTPSGIPDYRSKNGLYTQANAGKPAEYYLSRTCLLEQPEAFYSFVKQNMYYPDAKPNAIHIKQAALTKQNRASIITQNVDNLYNLADADHLIEFHGNLYDVYCQKCGRNVDWHQYLKSPVHEGCGGTLRPAIVLYDEGLDPERVQASVDLMSRADLVVIVGTSMRVYPFAGLLEYRNPNAKVIAINQEPLSLGIEMQMIQGDAVAFFKALTV